MIGTHAAVKHSTKKMEGHEYIFSSLNFSRIGQKGELVMQGSDITERDVEPVPAGS
jgi:hypothetical protein